MSGKRPTICQYGPTNTYLVATPIGQMEIVSCPKGLHMLSQIPSITDDSFSPNMSVKVSTMSQLFQDNGYTYKPALMCVEWLREYFKEDSHRQLVTPPICHSIAKEGSFTEKVWKFLPEKVQFGQTVSYTGLATLCGNSKACRAVGQAMRNNPLQLVVPCHRVIQEGGAIGNYNSGKKNKVKRWLLDHERIVK